MESGGAAGPPSPGSGKSSSGSKGANGGSTPSPSKLRVKVYQLDDNSAWEDRGTGHVTCSYVESLDSVCLVVKSEKEEQVLLESKIFMDDVYQVQQGTLIVWNDPETEHDLALSFQESTGCQEIWEQIVAIQNAERSDKEDVEESEDQVNRSVDEEYTTDIDLPPANLNNVDKILQVISECTSPSKREHLSYHITSKKIIPKLAELFSVCEDLDDEATLHKMFYIFRGIIMLNDKSVLDALFADDVILLMMGALEYDPELPTKANHREFLQKHAVFKQVVPFNNAELVSKIHQTYRIQYLKDVVLPRYPIASVLSMDDPTFATLNSYIFINKVEILSTIQTDDKFLSTLSQTLVSPDISADDFKDALRLVDELFNLSKHFQLQARMNFFGIMMRHKFCDVLELGLNKDDMQVRQFSVNTMDTIVTHDPSIFRTYVLSQKPHYSLFKLVISRFLSDPEMGIRVQLTEILRILIDISNMTEAPEKDDFLTVFYGNYIQQLVDALTNDAVDSSIKESVCDILGFCVVHHGFRIKYYLLGNNIVSRVTKLTKHKEKSVVLAAIRFFRSFVGVMDDFFNRHITKLNLFEPIVQVFKENGSRYNLLNSAIIELFEFIRKNNVKHLVQHLVENYKDLFEGINYVETFKGILIKYEQNMEEETKAGQSFAPPPANGTKEEDDDYFKEGSEGEEPAEAVQPVAATEEGERDFIPLTVHKEKEDDDVHFVAKEDPKSSDVAHRKGKISFNLSAALKESVSQPVQHEEEADDSPDAPALKKQRT